MKNGFRNRTIDIVGRTVALTAVLLVLQYAPGIRLELIAPAYAQEHGSGHTSGGGGSGSSGGGHSSGGHDSGGHDSGGHETDAHSGGQGGAGGHGAGQGRGGGGHASGQHTEGDEHEEGGDHGKRGPGSGFSGGGLRHVPSGVSGGNTGAGRGGDRQGGEGHSTVTGSSGGRPTWAGGGIPEVELGRLNVARSPAQVLQQALDEVRANWNPTLAAFYSQTVAQAAAELRTNYSNVTRIDSPLGNLGMYKELLSNPQLQLPGVTPASVVDLAAILLGSASDKNIPVSDNTVIAVNTILGVGSGLSNAQISELAQKADEVRAAIQTGHGE